MIICHYPSRKALKESVGKRLKYQETSIFGDEYRANGTFPVANRPHITGQGREFFAEVTMRDNLIHSVK